MPPHSTKTGNRKAKAGGGGATRRNLPKAADVAAERFEKQASGPESQALPAEPSGEGQNRQMNDLLSELREISGQVNRMMSQVDHAIHRLGVHTHAATPLKR